MQRRRFLTQAAAATGAGLAAVGLPAVAQDAPTVRWRMSTGWPKSLDALYGSAEALCRRVGELTNGKFEICLPLLPNAKVVFPAPGAALINVVETPLDVALAAILSNN
mgnify:CR=1 FL=1